MNDLTIGALLLITALVIFAFKRAYTSVTASRVKIVSVRSKIDGRTYSVQDKQDKQAAADMLARVRGKMISLIDCLKRTGGAGVKGSEDEKKFGDYPTRVDRLTSRFDADKIAEGNEDPKYTTYTLNKGEKMVFCLRARGQDDRVHDLEMMTFVAIHEMGHVASVTEHHTDEFHSNFKWLLESAVKCGIYRPENFKNNPRKYCGITVSDTPLA
jgi:hypothetical protein